MYIVYCMSKKLFVKILCLKFIQNTTHPYIYNASAPNFISTYLKSIGVFDTQRVNLKGVAYTLCSENAIYKFITITNKYAFVFILFFI